MPFTPAHPAIVLPFLRSRYFSATALITGTISPDFEYFFKAGVSGVHGHTIAGMFYFDLPVTIFLSLLFHRLVKPNLLVNLPYFLQQRSVPLLRLDYGLHIRKNLVYVLISSMVGASLHIFWDSFTHNGGYFVQQIDLYNHVYVPFYSVKYPLFYALQHISTITGFAIISVYVYNMPVDKEASIVQPKIQYWILLVLLSAVFFALRFLWLPRDFKLGNAVVTAMSAIMFSLCVLGFLPALRSNKNIQL